jgi:hypothetical protein
MYQRPVRYPLMNFAAAHVRVMSVRQLNMNTEAVAAVARLAMGDLLLSGDTGTSWQLSLVNPPVPSLLQIWLVPRN